MAAGAIETYLDTVHKEFKMHATWPPGALVEPGDIGVLRDGAFVRTSGLEDKDVQFKVKRREAPSMRFASTGGVRFRGTVSGDTDTAISAIAKAEVGLKIKFTKSGAIVFVLDPVRDFMISDVDSLAEWMLGQRGKQVKNDQVIVTHVRHAGSGVIAMASAAGAEVQLKTNAKIGKGAVKIADIKGKLELVTSTETEFVSVPHGRSGTTPLFRVLHFDDPEWWERWLLGRKPKVEASRRMNRSVGLSPSPRPVRGKQAIPLKKS